MPSVRRWRCYEGHAAPQFSLRAGTIFADSRVSLDKWLVALWLIVNAKNGISSYEIHRALGITQKTAWFLNHRVRMALHDGSFEQMLDGEVEVDETFIGGKARNMHSSVKARRITGRGPKDKTIVLGILERGGIVRTKVVGNRRKRTLQREVKETVAAGAALYSDDLASYEGLQRDYAHRTVNHAIQYVDGRVHTNTMESFWALLKRCLNGTWVSVEPFHLFRYLDEQAYRWNNRHGTDRGPVPAGSQRGRREAAHLQPASWQGLSGGRSPVSLPKTEAPVDVLDIITQRLIYSCVVVPKSLSG